MRCVRDPFRFVRDEEGFTSVAMVFSLLITLSLVFTAAQVYRVNTASAEVQNVADAAALAAQNEVAEFMIVVRVCDAVVLSLSLTGIIATGLGVAALCTPATASASETLLRAGREVIAARDSFAEKATSGLNHLQKTLPFLAAANAASVALANNGGPMNAEYRGLAVLVPAEGELIGIETASSATEFASEAQQESESIKEAAKRAEEAAQEANACKQRAFMRDCGDDPSYCMYERAKTLAGMTGTNNPKFSSVDTWSFSVAFERARTYYAHRLSSEEPEGSSVEEQAKSALRRHFYTFAVAEMQKGYVHETADAFEANFPHLPKNTAEMRQTSLYTQPVYPIAPNEEGGETMHAWSGCPKSTGASRAGSIAQLEEGSFTTCLQCHFTPASLGKVAAASTSIENGFEYHYNEVAQAAADYEKARRELDPLTAEVKQKAGGLFDRCLEALRSVGGLRIDAAPPGRYGTVVFVVNIGESAASTGFESGFVHEGGTLGTRAAVSAATLVGEASNEGKNVVSSLLDGIKGDGGALPGVMGVVLDCWAGLLGAYLEGQSALESTVARVVDALPFASASGLGTWAADALGKTTEALGLQPAELEALKPVLVNAAQVTGADQDSTFSARFLAVKAQAIENPLSSTDLFSSVISSTEAAALEGIAGLDGTIEIASIKLFGNDGPAIPITIALPPAVKNIASDFLSGVAQSVRSVYAQVVGVRVWE